MKLRRPWNRPAVLILAVLVALNAALAGAFAAGLRVNATASMPLGVYRITPDVPRTLARGTIVAICPSAGVMLLAAGRRYLAPGACPGNVEPLLKHVAALGGDAVDVSDRGVAVNGRMLPQSGRVERDCAGRRLARIAAGRYVLAPGTVWLHAPVARSWDSRYFGPQPVTGIIGVATPVLIVGVGRACAA